MFTKMIRKIASKIIMTTMLFSIVSPLAANNAYALNGVLSVGYDHAEGGYVVYDVNQNNVAEGHETQCTDNGNGYRVCEHSLPTGFYTVVFDDTATGFDPPADEDVQLSEIGAEIYGDYVLQSSGQNNGVLGIAVNHFAGGYRVYDVNQTLQDDIAASSCPEINGWFFCESSLPSGFYSIEYYDVPDYEEPIDEDIQLPESKVTLYRSYDLINANNGMLNIGMNHFEGGYQVFDVSNTEVAKSDALTCAPAQPNGYFVCQESLPTGFYTIVFDNTVAGYDVVSEIQDVQLHSGTTDVWGNYVPQGGNNGQLNIHINHVDGGYKVFNVNNAEVASGDASTCPEQNSWYNCQESLPSGFYTVVYTDVTGFNKPSDNDVQLPKDIMDIWGLYTVEPAGVIEVKVVDQNNNPITNLPGNEWQLMKCTSNTNSNSCHTTVASGGPGNVYQGLAFTNYRIVFPNPAIPAGYTSRYVLPNDHQVLDANNTSLLFTIKYTKQQQSSGTAYLNVNTSPVEAQVRMTETDPSNSVQNGVTSQPVNMTTFDLADADRFELPTLNNGQTAPTDFYIQCMPAPVQGQSNQAYLAPAIIQIDNGVYQANQEELVATCNYIPTSDAVTISVDTIGIQEAAIYVDGVEVRATNDDAETFVTISLTEEHTISFEPKDTSNFITPPAIVIPADSLNATMTAEELKYLGYYVATGNLGVANVNTQNENGWVYLTINGGASKYNVGMADTSPAPLEVHFDETQTHEFHFQDKNPDVHLRAVPTSFDGFSVGHDGVTVVNNNVTHFQENYAYDGMTDFTGTPVELVGDYIAHGNAAFFRARSTNADPIFGEIYLDINGEPTETLIPGAATFTRVFISDVQNDQDVTRFESPILSNTYFADTPQYDLSTYQPGTVVNDLETTYITGGGPTDLTVRLVSLDSSNLPIAGLPVIMDTTTTESTVENGQHIDAQFSNVDTTVAHTIVCPTYSNYLMPPNDIYLPANSMQPGQIVYCLYVNGNDGAEILIETEAVDDTDLEAPITLNVDGTDYYLGYTQATSASIYATLTAYVNTTLTNTVRYGDVAHVPPYTIPTPDPVGSLMIGSSPANNPENIFHGLYTLGGGSGASLTFHLRRLDPVGGPVPGTAVTLGGGQQQLSDSNGDTTFTDVDVLQGLTANFADFSNFVTPHALTFDPGQLLNGNNYEFTVYYVPVPFAVTLEVSTIDENDSTINVDGEIWLSVNGAPATFFGFGNTSILLSNEASVTHQIHWGPALVPNYIEPVLDPQDVDLTGVAAGGTEHVDGLYRLCPSGQCEVVNIRTTDDTGNNVIPSVIMIGGLPVSTTGEYSAVRAVNETLNITFEALAAYSTPEVFVNSTSVGDTYNHSYVVVAGQNSNNVEARYGLGQAIAFNVGTQDHQQNPLTEDITHGVPNGTQTTVATPALVGVAEADLADYLITFDAMPGYMNPGAVAVQNQAIASIPANVTITHNGAAYVPGTTLALGDTYDIIGTYTPYFTVEKNAVETTIANNNKRVDYQLVVTRNAPNSMGSIALTLHDTLSDSSRTLTGSNGGTMTAVSQNGDYSICSNSCGDITAGSVSTAIDSAGSQITIAYQLVSTNTGIPTNQASDFTNTFTVTFDDGGQSVDVTADATVNVLAPPTGPGPGPSGGGGGGGVIMVRGDMILEVTKLVSLDNRNFVDASDEEDPLAISERVDSTIFTKVNVKNLGQVSATNIKYTEGFDEGDSKITSDEIQNVEGEAGVEYNETTGVISIDKLIVGGEVNFSYEQILHENGSKGELAEEYLVLEGFSTKLGQNQDGLTKHGIGDHYPSWIVAGSPTTVVDGDLLELSIETDKSAARVGEEVTYTITAKNNADFDFTGLTITWDYDENALEILNPNGGKDNGTEIHWNRGTLRPGQTVKYVVRSRVSDTAPTGDNVRTTARGLVNQIENPSVVDHYLTIIAGIGPGDVNLAQTGLPTFMLILVSVLAYLGYTQTGRRRYLALKKLALS